jgi:hypothetical protein
MIFPDGPTLPHPNGYDWHFDFATILSQNPESGGKQSRPGRSVDLLFANLQFPIRPIADYNELRAFCRWAQGMNRVFTFRDFNGMGNPPLAPWPISATYGGSIYVGVSNGLNGSSDRTYDLPFSNTTGAVVYDNGAAASNYSISAGTGADGRDQAIFTSTHNLAAGHVLSATCTLGRLTINARLGTDSFAGRTFVGGGGPIQPTLSIVQEP